MEILVYMLYDRIKIVYKNYKKKRNRTEQNKIFEMRSSISYLDTMQSNTNKNYFHVKN